MHGCKWSSKIKTVNIEEWMELKETLYYTPRKKCSCD